MSMSTQPDSLEPRRVFPKKFLKDALTNEVEASQKLYNVFDETDNTNPGYNGTPQYCFGGGDFLNKLQELSIKAIRGADEITIYDFLRVVCESITNKEEKELLIRFLFYLRDCRGGKAERKLPFMILFELYNMGFKSLVNEVFAVIPEFGRAKDPLDFLMFVVADWNATKSKEVHTEIVNHMLDLIASQDSTPLNNKWKPREDKKKAWQRDFKSFYGCSIVTALVKRMWPDELKGLSGEGLKDKLSHLKKRYRKNIAKDYTVEALICTQRESEIDPKTIPSGAWPKHMSVFGNEKGLDRREGLKERIIDFLTAGGGIHGGQANLTVFIQQILDERGKPIKDIEQLVMNAQADDLVKVLLKQCQDYAVEYGLDGIAVQYMAGLIDVSGSMFSSANGKSSGPILYAILVGYLVAKLGTLKGLITFESTPKWVDLSDVIDNFYECVKKIKDMEWGGNTNFTAALELLIEKANEANLSPDEFPKYLIIPSDMQINAAEGYQDRSKTMDERIDDLFKDSKYPKPMVVYWNLSPYTSGKPAKSDTPGVALFSGQSPAIFTQILSGHMAQEVVVESTEAPKDAEDDQDEEGTKPETRKKNPVEIMRDALLRPRYDGATEKCLEALQKDEESNALFA